VSSASQSATGARSPPAAKTIAPSTHVMSYGPTALVTAAPRLPRRVSLDQLGAFWKANVAVASASEIVPTPASWCPPPSTKRLLPAAMARTVPSANATSASGQKAKDALSVCSQSSSACLSVDEKHVPSSAQGNHIWQLRPTSLFATFEEPVSR
jgi:hypothetical protein